jgi:hypothetical protein
MAKENSTIKEWTTFLIDRLGWDIKRKCGESTTMEMRKILNVSNHRTFLKNRFRTCFRKKDIVAETIASYTYLQSRFSKQITFTLKVPRPYIYKT